MKLKSHIYQGIVLGPAVYYFTNFKTAIIFLSSFILIDIDHYFLYIRRCNRVSLPQMFTYFDHVWENHRSKIYELCIFHTVEFFLLLFILGYWRKEFRIVLFGFLLHFLFDLYHLFKHKIVFTRAFSIIEYFIRRKRYERVIVKYPEVPSL